MDWKKIYEEKLCSADAAVKTIKDGDTVILAHSVGEPPALVEAMVANHKQYKDVTIRHMVSLGAGGYAEPGMEEHFTVDPFFASANTRKALAEGRGNFTPSFFHEVPKLIREGLVDCDVAMVMASPPDEHGFCSLGIAVDYTKEAFYKAKKTMVQINKNYPRTYGDSYIHVSEMDYIVEEDCDLVELPPPNISDVEKAIGEYCASLVEDGSTLQLGIGAIPDAVMLFLNDKKDLGIHSEMISDGTLALYEKGVITNKKKSVDPGKMSVTFVMGTKKLYDFVDNNPVVEVRPVDYINHPVTVMKQHKMISINSAMQVDLQGQVNAEAVGLRQFSGVGGQVDFIRGVAMGTGGKAIISMPSVTIKRDGTMISKIVPFLDQGAPVTTSRNDIDYVVTEYGIAELKGKSLRQRAKNLINIAHPDTKQPLIDEYEKRFSEKF